MYPTQHVGGAPIAQPPVTPLPRNDAPAPEPSNVTSDTKDISAITVDSRIPEFWTDQPRVWFIRAESVLNPQKCSDDAKFQVLISKLGKAPIQQVTDIPCRPPDTGRYETLKARLLDIYEESENRQVQKLIGEMELGDQKPSQLLRRMRDLARDKIPDDTLRVLWQGHLPAAVRTVLAITETKDMEKLAAAADKAMETLQPSQLSVVEAKVPAQTSGNKDILTEIAKLSIRMRNMERFQRKGSRRGHQCEVCGVVGLLYVLLRKPHQSGQ